MRTRTLVARIERAEQAAKAQSKVSPECICFPENEKPSFVFPVLEDMAIRLLCPTPQPTSWLRPFLVGGFPFWRSHHARATSSQEQRGLQAWRLSEVRSAYRSLQESRAVRQLCRASFSIIALSIETRCLSKCVKCFCISRLAVHSGSTGISQAGHADYEELTQWRASLSQCRQIFMFIIGDPIFPATE
jgi:hypothetical protein